MPALTIQEIAKKTKLKPAIVRARLRRNIKHNKGARWVIPGNQLPRIMRLLTK